MSITYAKGLLASVRVTVAGKEAASTEAHGKGARRASAYETSGKKKGKEWSASESTNRTNR